MLRFELRGIAEGITGQSTVTADSFKDLLNRYPALRNIEDKLTLDGNVVNGFAPCDG